ncbi:MAG: glucose-6-phosphate isomerase, partial [Muribaculum intestinale]|nr:glucose-6-phosphate isomerase [Muribaculum intestinale]
MEKIKLDINSVLKFVSEKEIRQIESEEANKAIDMVKNGTGEGNDFLGWYDLPSRTSMKELDEIIEVANDLRNSCEYVVSVGIGGSYLGAKAVIEALNNSFDAYTSTSKGAPKVLFAGQNIGEEYLAELQEFLKDKKFGIIVISKSGTTTEPAIAFRLLKEQLEAQAGKEAAKNLIVAITDAKRGALRQLATEEGYRTFVIEDNVGGRFSVLTPVG